MTNNSLANITNILQGQSALPLHVNMIDDNNNIIIDYVYNGKINTGHMRALFDFLYATYWHYAIDSNTKVKIGYKHVNKGSDIVVCDADRYHMVYDNKNKFTITNTETYVMRKGTINDIDITSM